MFSSSLPSPHSSGPKTRFQRRRTTVVSLGFSFLFSAGAAGSSRNKSSVYGGRLAGGGVWWAVRLGVWQVGGQFTRVSEATGKWFLGGRRRREVRGGGRPLFILLWSCLKVRGVGGWGDRCGRASAWCGPCCHWSPPAVWAGRGDAGPAGCRTGGATTTMGCLERDRERDQDGDSYLTGSAKEGFFPQDCTLSPFNHTATMLQCNYSQ